MEDFNEIKLELGVAEKTKQGVGNVLGTSKCEEGIEEDGRIRGALLVQEGEENSEESVRNDFPITAGFAVGKNDAVIFGVVEILQFVHKNSKSLVEIIHLQGEDLDEAEGEVLVKCTLP